MTHHALVGLPSKPALRHLFMFDWYRDAHGAIPRRRGQALSRIYRWWMTLSPEARAKYCDMAERQIREWNESWAEWRRKFEAQRLVLLTRLRELKGATS